MDLKKQDLINLFIKAYVGWAVSPSIGTVQTVGTGLTV
jgi:hypothetical protein